MLIHIDRRTGRIAHCSDLNCPVTPHALTAEAAQQYRLRLLGLRVLTARGATALPWEFRPF